MKIYYKENTGLKTAQDENCDYFVLNTIGAKMVINSAYAEILFWEKLEHAQGGKPANLSRTIQWDIKQETSIDSGVNTLFTSDSLQTTPSSFSWNGWMADAPYTTADGLWSGFQMVNWNQLMSLLNQSNSGLLNYPPFNYDVYASSARRIIHSTTSAALTGNILEFTGASFAFVAKTTARSTMLYRQFTLAELGL